MQSILKHTIIATIFTGFASSAQAIEFTPLNQTGQTSCLTAELEPDTYEDTDCFGGYAPMASREMPKTLIETKETTIETGPAKIAIARLHDGRFLPLPDQEAPSWATLNNTGNAFFSPLSASTHFDILPEIAQNGVDSDNKIDEIRLTAAAQNQDYVLIYAVSDGAAWGRFGDRDLDATGLRYDDASDAVRDGDAKALLVEAYTGQVVGAVTTFAPDMKTLTKLVADMTYDVLES